MMRLALWLQHEAAHSNLSLPLRADPLAEVLPAKLNCDVGHRQWPLSPVGERCQLWQSCGQLHKEIPVPRDVWRLGLGTSYALLPQAAWIYSLGPRTQEGLLVLQSQSAQVLGLLK